MADQPTPSPDDEEQHDPPMNRAARRAARHGKKSPPPTSGVQGGVRGGWPAPPAPRRFGRRGNR